MNNPRKLIKKVEYQKKYLCHAGTIMMKTWKYHDLLIDCKDPAFIYQQLFKRAYMDRKYTEFYVDENDCLVGIFITISTKIPRSFKQVCFLLENIIYLLIGKFGKRKLALSVIVNMEKDTEEVLEGYEQYGFKRLKEIHSKYFLCPQLEKNTFSYAYKIRRQ